MIKYAEAAGSFHVSNINEWLGHGLRRNLKVSFSLFTDHILSTPQKLFFLHSFSHWAEQTSIGKVSPWK